MQAKEDGSTNVTLHANELDIDESSVTLTEVGSNEQLGILEHTYDTDRQFYILKLDRSIKKNEEYLLIINFTAKLKDGGFAGFFRSSYTDRFTGKQE